METVKEKLAKLIVDSTYFINGETALDIAEYLIQNGVTIQEWVSVDERLPEKDKEYNVAIDGAVRSTHLYFDGEAWFDEYGNTYKVLYWTGLPPLPQPPRGCGDGIFYM